MKKSIPCPRCGGIGAIAEFSHVDSGICFRCRGLGRVEIVDNNQWTFHEAEMYTEIDFEWKYDSTSIHYRSYDPTGVVVSSYSNVLGERRYHKVLTAKTKEWARKIYYVLGLWAHEDNNVDQAWIKLHELKATKSPGELATLINDEYARAETRPGIKHRRYSMYNTDTYESYWCDKDGNPIDRNSST